MCVKTDNVIINHLILKKVFTWSILGVVSVCWASEKPYPVVIVTSLICYIMYLYRITGWSGAGYDCVIHPALWYKLMDGISLPASGFISAVLSEKLINSDPNLDSHQLSNRIRCPHPLFVGVILQFWATWTITLFNGYFTNQLHHVVVLSNKAELLLVIWSISRCDGRCGLQLQIQTNNRQPFFWYYKEKVDLLF